MRTTLSSLPSYFLSLFHLLAGIARKLEWIQRDFLWDGFDGDHKLHQVNWKTIYSSVPRVGLGVKNFTV
jgi:hypothetical protein